MPGDCGDLGQQYSHRSLQPDEGQKPWGSVSRMLTIAGVQGKL